MTANIVLTHSYITFCLAIVIFFVRIEPIKNPQKEVRRMATMRIGEATAIVGVCGATIRNWDREGLIRLARDDRMHRVIKDSQIPQLLQLKAAMRARRTEKRQENVKKAFRSLQAAREARQKARPRGKP